MKRLLLACALAAASSGAAWADFDRGMVAYRAGDFERAYDEFLADAVRGHATAQFNVGVMHYRGEGVARDLIEAYAWLELATQRRGDGELLRAQESLSVLLTSDEIAAGFAAAERLARDHGLPFRPATDSDAVASY